MIEKMKFEGGFVARNGVCVVPCDESYFVEGKVAVLHFKEEDWHMYGCAYPEIAPVAYRRPINEFCFPHAGEYELFRNEDNEIVFRVFISHVMKTPVLEWILPEVNSATIGIYKAFIQGL